MADVVAAIAAVVLVAASAIVGAILEATGHPVYIETPPIFAVIHPHVSASTPVALALAALVVWNGPAWSRTVPWRRLLLASWATSVAWILALALVDGWTRFARIFVKPSEYVSEVPNAPPWKQFLPTFAGRIVDGQPDSWATHVAGHPPGAFAFFVLLDRIGLGGPAIAAVIVVLLGATGGVAVAVALRALGHEELARRALPFLVLAPAAIWIGVSADAFFLCVTAWGIALLCVATASRGPRSDLAALGAGLLLGGSLYLSYGFVLFAIPALAVVAYTRRLRPALVATAAVAAVVVAVTAGGFAWWEAYELLVVRYNQGVGGLRPDGYWIWANFGALALATGPAVAAGLRRAATRENGVRVLVGAVIACVLVASLSGMSKSEVERIWLPFTIWLLASCALLPADRHRHWLAVQAGAALLLQHLLLTWW